MLGELQMSSKDDVAAQKQFEATVALTPKWWIPYRNMALLRLARKDMPGAIAAYEKGIDNTGHNIALVTDLATLHENEGRSDQAIKLYEAVLAIDPKQDSAANNLAMALITYRNDKASADRARDLTAAFANSNNGALLDTFGWVRFRRGELAEGLPALERAAELAPQTGIIRYHLGMAQLQAGQNEKARSNLKAALDANQAFAGRDEAHAALTALEKKAG